MKFRNLLLILASFFLTTVTLPTNTLAWNSVDDGGTYSISAPVSHELLVIGWDGIGTVFHNSDTNSISGQLQLGKEFGSLGTYNLFDGNLQVESDAFIGIRGSGIFNQSNGLAAFKEDLIVGFDEGGIGQYNQSGGSTSITETLYLGYNAGALGEYQLSAGTLASEYQNIGHSGSGTFIQTGGSNVVNNSFWIGKNEGSTGQYNLSDGTLSSGYGTIGRNGSGLLVQSGGSNSITYNLHLGLETGSTGEYQLSAGTLSAEHENVGLSGSGVFIQSGGSNTINSDLTIGFEAGSTGTYQLSAGDLMSTYQGIGEYGSGTFIQSGGSNTATDALWIGAQAGATGEYHLTDGDLAAAFEVVGESGSGVFIQSGGSNTVTNNFIIGYHDNSTGEYQLSGGTLNIKNEFIGLYNNSHGIFSQTGGTHDVEKLSITNGVYNLYAGTLKAGEIINDENGTSTLNLHGGQISVDNSAINFDNIIFHTNRSISDGDEFISKNQSIEAVITQTGGTNSTSSMTLNGIYNQSGGTVSSNLSISQDGAYNQTGGTKSGRVSINNGVYNNTGGIHNGSVYINGGTYNLKGLSPRLGYKNGKHNGDVFIYNGTYNLTGADEQIQGFETVGGALSAGVISIENGTFNHEGFSVSANSLFIDGGGTYNFSDYRNTKQFDGSGWTHTASGSLEVRYVYIGDGSGTAVLNQAGGSAVFNNIEIGFDGRGSYDGANAIVKDSIITGNQGEIQGKVEQAQRILLGMPIRDYDSFTVDMGGSYRRFELSDIRGQNPEYELETLSAIFENQSSEMRSTLSNSTTEVLVILDKSSFHGTVNKLGYQLGGFSNVINNGTYYQQGGKLSHVTNHGIFYGKTSLLHDHRAENTYGVNNNETGTFYHNNENAYITVDNAGLFEHNRGAIQSLVNQEGGIFNYNYASALSVYPEIIHILNNGTLNISLQDGGDHLIAYKLDNNGTINWDKGMIEILDVQDYYIPDFFTGLTNNGEINFLGEGEKNIVGGLKNNGIINVTNTVVQSNPTLNPTYIGFYNGFTNFEAGILNLQDNSQFNFVNSTFTNQGKINIEQGSNLTSTNSYDQQTGHTVVNGILTAPTVNVFGGSISGSGTILGDVDLYGAIGPGNSPGMLTIDGDLNAYAGSIFQFEIAGYDIYDSLNITGALNLLGEITLELTFLDDFLPQKGREFNFFLADEIIGDLSLISFDLIGYDDPFEGSMAFGPTGNEIMLAFNSDQQAVPTPEPSTFLLLGLGLLGLLAAGRKRLHQ